MIDQTLVEKMHITDGEIIRRKALFGLDNENLSTLSGYKQLIESHIDEIVQAFYQHQLKNEMISQIIGDADTLSRLKVAQRNYVLDLFSGDYDSEYVNNRLRIGMVHKRIGVEPKLYISAVVTLKACIYPILEKGITDSQQRRTVWDLLDRLVCFDTSLVFDTYISGLVGAVQAEKSRTETYARELEDQVSQKTELAKRDPLTELYNHRVFHESLHRELSLAKRRKSYLSLVYIDVDDFKLINDTHGHLYGDQILKSICEVIRSKLRKTDIACRIGGDEFCLILLDCDEPQSKEICEKIVAELRERKVESSLSIGIHSYHYQDGHINSNQIIDLADQKMYQAKKVEGDAICSVLPES